MIMYFTGTSPSDWAPLWHPSQSCRRRRREPDTHHSGMQPILKCTAPAGHVVGVEGSEALEGANVPSPPMAAADERRDRFEALYQAHHGPVLGYVLRRTENPEDAADVMAETFLTSWRRLEEVP